MTLRRFLPMLLPMPLAALTLLGGGAQAQTVLQVSTWLPATHAASVAQAAWCKAVEEGTKGSVRCNLLAKPVSPPPATFDAVRDGLADVSYTVDGYTPGRFVFTQVAEFPFLGDSAMATTLAYQRIYDKYFAPLGEHKGVKVLAVFTHGPGSIFTIRDAVDTPADAARLKFRIGGGNINELSKLMGWNVTLKPATQSYELLSTGVMDGTFFPDEAVQSMRLGMVKHATTFPGGLYNTSFVFMMNPAAYEKLRPEERAVIDRVSGEAAARLFAEGWDRADAASREIQKSSGVDRRAAGPALVDAVRSRQTELKSRWVAAAEARGLKNARQVLAEFRAEAQKAR